jgi:tRNA(fMet)-specific endonuclease VapC
MPRYMLDADTVSYVIRGRREVVARLLEHRPSELCLSSITLAELRFGADAKNSRKIHKAIENFVAEVEVIPFDEVAADRFGRVCAALARRGEPIGTFDTLVAAHALSQDLTVVTNNTRHYARVPGLKVENWA